MIEGAEEEAVRVGLGRMQAGSELGTLPGQIVRAASL